MMPDGQSKIPSWLLIFALLFASCASRSASPADFFPDADVSPTWTPTRDVEVFDRENIYDLVDGQADAFFAYGFEQVAVQRYEDAAGDQLDVEVWQLATPADAYGLFTTNISGEPVAVGNEGDADPDRRLTFWQERYYVHVRARQDLDDAVLRAFAQAISMALPIGGERPALMARLPSAGLVERSALFFHEEISIQDQVWLGGENLLGLSQDTACVLAQYDVGGAAARLLLVQYPDTEAASAGLAALESGQVDGLVVASTRDTLLGAMFGQMGANVDETAANALLVEVLQDM